MDERREVDAALCDRFVTALMGCFSDHAGKFNEEAAAREFIELDREDLALFRRHEAQPTEELLGLLIKSCDAFDTGWLRTGLTDEALCDRMIKTMHHNRIDPVDAAKDLFVTKEFFGFVKDYKLMPSRVFINRFCEKYGIPLQEIYYD
ncbi:hypothetical protein QA601_17490 [Chitinispirillales bacterium ANBcel5]|uniref:hypothetical protein n=1 Tax=Cellulosispirillum alkaliphilum TaxID=3039283 RepID=UPI002A542EA9|nr:hypothetical protein [Chitinispirillales bacterium ANBcel5]